MLRRIAELRGSRVLAFDGEVGKVRDAYVHEVPWAARYLVVDTGGWLSGRRVLVDTRSVELMEHHLRTVWLSLSRERIESSPRIDLQKPVSGAQVLQLNRHYGYPLEPPAPMLCDSGASLPHPPLRGAREILQSALITVDGWASAIKDVFFDDETWRLRYLIVQTGSWLLGRRVLVPVEHVRGVDWTAHRVKVDQTRQQVEQGREFDAHHPPPGDRESALNIHASSQRDPRAG